MNKAIKFLSYKTIDSTMDEAKRLIKSDKITDTTCIITYEQTAGRGTHGKKWSSQANSGIYMSLVHIAPHKSLFDLTTMYTLSAGIACIEALQDTFDLEIFLKPVNDLYVRDPRKNPQNLSKYAKLGGILTESILSKDKISALITGVGINTHKAQRNFDQKITFENKDVLPIALENLLENNEFRKFTEKNLINKLANKIDYWHNFVFEGKTNLVQETWDKYSLNVTN